MTYCITCLSLGSITHNTALGSRNPGDLTVLDMKVGEERRIVVPSDLGYGAKGASGAIPGGATLYFDMELVEIGQMSQLGPEQLKWLEDNPL